MFTQSNLFLTLTLKQICTAYFYCFHPWLTFFLILNNVNIAIANLTMYEIQYIEYLCSCHHCCSFYYLASDFTIYNFLGGFLCHYVNNYVMEGCIPTTFCRKIFFNVLLIIMIPYEWIYVVRNKKSNQIWSINDMTHWISGGKNSQSVRERVTHKNSTNIQIIINQQYATYPFLA